MQNEIQMLNSQEIIKNDSYIKDPLIFFSLNKNDPIKAFKLEIPYTLSALNRSYIKLLSIAEQNDNIDSQITKQNLNKAYSSAWELINSDDGFEKQSTTSRTFLETVLALLRNFVYLLLNTLLVLVFFLVFFLIGYYGSKCFLNHSPETVRV